MRSWNLSDLDHRPLIVATVTPLSADGAALDLDAIGPYVASSDRAWRRWSVRVRDHRRGRAPDARRATAGGDRLPRRVDGYLVVHAGAQTTADTVALAAHAREIGADAVAVIPPPYFPLDADALTAHFVAAARACAPVPFYCYAFTGRSGYPLPVEVIRRIGASVDNLAGLKVSESPFERVEPYLDLGLPVLIGSEPLLSAGIARGAIGTVSGMAAVFPDIVRSALDAADDAAAERLARLRAALDANGKLIAGAKHVLGQRGVAVNPSVRAPLQALTATEAAALDESLAAFLAPTAA